MRRLGRWAAIGGGVMLGLASRRSLRNQSLVTSDMISGGTNSAAAIWRSDCSSQLQFFNQFQQLEWGVVIPNGHLLIDRFLCQLLSW